MSVFRRRNGLDSTHAKCNRVTNITEFSGFFFFTNISIDDKMPPQVLTVIVCELQGLEKRNRLSGLSNVDYNRVGHIIGPVISSIS